MTMCTWCNLEQRKADGCAVTTITLDGVVFERIPHGLGRGWSPAVKRCGDCGAEPDNIHHPGCQYEECPKCGSAQMFACDCEKNESP